MLRHTASCTTLHYKSYEQIDLTVSTVDERNPLPPLPNFCFVHGGARLVHTRYNAPPTNGDRSALHRPRAYEVFFFSNVSNDIHGLLLIASEEETREEINIAPGTVTSLYGLQYNTHVPVSSYL